MPTSDKQPPSASGGSRAQRRNRQKHHRDDAAEAPAADGRKKRRRDETVEAVAPAADGNAAAQPPKKKTKKEKKKEKKAAAAMEAEATARRGAPAPAEKPEVAASSLPDLRDPVAKGLRVFVGHLPQSTTEAELRSRFGGCGQIDEVMMLKRHNGRFKGIAFVTFQRKSQASRAIALSGTPWDAEVAGSKHIVVSQATAKTDEAPAALTADEAPTASCFVGNLPAAITTKEVRATFRDVCGPKTIRKVSLMPTVGETRRGFVDFATSTAATAALALNGTSALGRTLIVSFSRRSEAPSGDGRRSREARVRRRLKRDDQRSKEDGEKPILALGGGFGGGSQ